MNKNRLNTAMLAGGATMSWTRFAATQVMRLLSTANLATRKMFAATQAMRLIARTAYVFFRTNQPMVMNYSAKMLVKRNMGLAAAQPMRLIGAGTLRAKRSMGATQIMRLSGSGTLTTCQQVRFSATQMLRLLTSGSTPSDWPADRVMIVDASDRTMTVEADSLGVAA